MAKNDEKYLYVTISLTRGSDAEKSFTRDMERHHMTDNPGKLAGLRLTEFYELMEQGIIAPSLQAMLRARINEQSTELQSRSNPASSAGEISSANSVTGEDSMNTGLLRVDRHAEKNAEDAGDYWAPL